MVGVLPVDAGLNLATPFGPVHAAQVLPVDAGLNLHVGLNPWYDVC